MTPAILRAIFILDEGFKSDAQRKAVFAKRGAASGSKSPSSSSGTSSLEKKVPETFKEKMIQKFKDLATGKSKGEDLCKVSVPGTNLFCGNHKGIPREKMPQIPRDKIPAFLKSLKGKDGKSVAVKSDNVDVTELKATQNQLNGEKVAGMRLALAKHGMTSPEVKGITDPIIVSKDGYVLDGHHRWAALVAKDLTDRSSSSVKMKITRVDMDISSLVKAANNFDGVTQAGFSAPSDMSDQKKRKR